VIFFPDTTYKVTVKTSEEKGAGTDANVYVCLFGENGDSGALHLKDSETNSSAFEAKQEDVFTIQDVLSLGELTKCRVYNKGLPFTYRYIVTCVIECEL